MSLTKDFTRRLARYRDLVEDWPAFLEASRTPLPTTLWANTLRGSVREVADVLAGDGIETEPIGWYDRGFRISPEARPGKSLAFVTGYVQIQEEVSLLPVHFLAPRPGERILDLCAAPGNKTVQGAVHMENRGTLVANDINLQRLGMVMRNIDRLGITNAYVTHHNGTNLPSDLGKFDRVLADVPCGCEGTTRKNPGILGSEPPDPRKVSGRQAALLRKAVERCRPGGRIVYSTCTYAPEENEEVVHGVLEEFADLRVVEAKVEGLLTVPGITEWQGQSLRPELARTLRFYPHLNDTGGFYVAVLERLPEPAEAVS